jgi:hypothetical protein
MIEIFLLVEAAEAYQHMMSGALPGGADDVARSLGSGKALWQPLSAVARGAILRWMGPLVPLGHWLKLALLDRQMAAAQGGAS